MCITAKNSGHLLPNVTSLHVSFGGSDGGTLLRYRAGATSAGLPPQDRAPELLADLVQNPQSEHGRYIAPHVIPDLHDADPSAGPPPTVQKVATIDT